MTFRYFFFTALQHCISICEVPLLGYLIYFHLTILKHVEQIVAIECDINQISRVLTKY